MLQAFLSIQIFLEAWARAIREADLLCFEFRFKAGSSSV
jgi:hypothetical protein